MISQPRVSAWARLIAVMNSVPISCLSDMIIRTKQTNRNSPNVRSVMERTREKIFMLLRPLTFTR